MQNARSGDARFPTEIHALNTFFHLSQWTFMQV